MQAVNPYLPSYEYVPDGEPHVFGDRIYVFGSHDLFNSEDFCLGDYVCWSAPIHNLADWRYDGIIYKKEQDPKNSDGKLHMCAPDVTCGTDGRYYLYYQLHALKCTSVAVADRPEGSYEFYGYVQHPDGTPWGDKKGDSFAFDPGVLADDDGNYYLYVGFSPNPGFFKTIQKLRGCRVEESVCLKLAKDMITVKDDKEWPIVPGPQAAIGTSFEGHGFYEASSPRKINGKYYLVYSSILSHELCYAISDYPDYGFRYGGTIISIGDIGYQGRTQADNYTGNTHGGLVEINGQWYVFYHRQTNKQKCCRQGCADQIFIEEDGSIAQVEMTSCGLNGAPLKGKGTYEARIACVLQSAVGTFSYLKTREKDKKGIHPYFTQTGKDREQNGDQYIANMTKGSIAGFKYFYFGETDNTTISISVKSKENGVMEIRTKEHGSAIAKISVRKSDIWTSFEAEKVKLEGVQALYFIWNGEKACDFQSFTIDNMRFI